MLRCLSLSLPPCCRSGRSILHHKVSAPDGTSKFLLQLADGRIVETVGIPSDEDHGSRLTVCVSSQVRRFTAARIRVASVFALSALPSLQRCELQRCSRNGAQRTEARINIVHMCLLYVNK